MRYFYQIDYSAFFIIIIIEFRKAGLFMCAI